MTANAPPTVPGLTSSIRLMVLALHGRRCAAQNVDLEDLVQDVYVRILEKQHSERSRYDRSRGHSLTSYQYMVSRSAGLDALRKYTRWGREVPASGEERNDYRGERPERQTEGLRAEERAWANAPAQSPEPLGPTLDRLLELLDLDEEKEMAAHLCAGCSIAEAGRRMGLDEEAASELVTRVRALLWPLRDDE